MESAPDPFFFLPVVLGGLMFLQQKLMPPQGMDPMQTKMLVYFMPGFMTMISLLLPSGLALDPSGHWLISAGQDDGRIAVMKLNPETGKLTDAHQSAAVPAAMDVVFSSGR